MLLQMPKPSEESPLKIVSTKEDLIQMCDSLKRETEFAVDLEVCSKKRGRTVTGVDEVFGVVVIRELQPESCVSCSSITRTERFKGSRV